MQVAIHYHLQYANTNRFSKNACSDNLIIETPIENILANDIFPYTPNVR